MRNRTVQRVGDFFGRMGERKHQKQIDQLTNDPTIPEDTRKVITLLAADPQATNDALIAALGIDAGNPSAERMANIARTNALLFMDGKITPGRALTVPAPKEARDSSGPLDADYTIEQGISGVPLSIANMTPAQLEARRIAQVEAADFSRGPHDAIMLFLLRIWLVMGPIVYVGLTSGEIAFLFSLIAPNALTILIWGGALMIDITLMFVTFALSRNKQRVHELETSGLAVPTALRRNGRGLTWSWLGLAFVSLVGQTAYLLAIAIHGTLPMWLYYALIATRVLGFTLCDAVTAFFLSQLGTKAEEVARIDELKGRLHVRIAESTGEHKKAAARANMDIVKIDLEIERERRWAAFHAELDKLMIAETLQRQRSKMIDPPDNDTGGETALPS
jgi:hypothetical protein